MTELEYKKCPHCGEEIKAIAAKCKYCKNWVANESDVLLDNYSEDSVRPGYVTERYRGKKPGTSIIVLGILLIFFGCLGIFMSALMFGDIAIAAIIGSVAAILSGIGFLFVAVTLKSLN